MSVRVTPGDTLTLGRPTKLFPDSFDDYDAAPATTSLPTEGSSCSRAPRRG